MKFNLRTLLTTLICIWYIYLTLTFLIHWAPCLFLYSSKVMTKLNVPYRWRDREQQGIRLLGAYSMSYRLDLNFFSPIFSLMILTRFALASVEVSLTEPAVISLPRLKIIQPESSTCIYLHLLQCLVSYTSKVI